MANFLQSNLLEEALAYHEDEKNGAFIYGSGRGRMIVVEDCVDTSGAFVLHDLLKRFLSPHSSDGVIFIALANSFPHYDRILRKMGCNLAVHREKKRLLFFDMLMPAPINREEDKTSDDLFIALYGKIHKELEVRSSSEGLQHMTIIVDDFSLMEIDANGSSNLVLDLLHYLCGLRTQFGCSLVTRIHEDVYSTRDRPNLLLQMEYLSDVVIKVEPLVTGLATDVHGQLTVLNKGRQVDAGKLRNKVHRFHFRNKDSGTEYFYPGCRS